MNIKQHIGLCSILLTSIITHADISGTVFQDVAINGVNSFGTKQTNELGLEGIKVTAYPGGETNTAADGRWSLATSGKVRVEFTDIPVHLKESAGESSVQFIDGDKSDVNLALYNPAEYSNGINNDIAMTFQPNSNLSGTLPVLKVLSPIANSQRDTIPNTIGDIAINKMGAVWGLAYDATHKTLYASAVVRRYSALGEINGTVEAGAIYKMDRSTPSNPVVTLFTTVPNTGSNTIPQNRGLSANPTQPSHDPIFDQVGRTGLGDLDISEDGTKLYTVNLNSNKLVEIDIATKAQTAYNIGNPFDVCTDVKSWGIGQKDGAVYVGSVCTTDTSKGATISKLNGTTFSVVHNIPLDMEGENSIPPFNDGTGNTQEGLGGDRWRTWITKYSDLFKTDANGPIRVSYPAPILSDIVFTENSGMVLGFTDRTAMQAGIKNYSPNSDDNTTYKYDASGDIYKVCKTDTGYANESDDECPLDNRDEFFNEEEWEGGVHKEIALGGLAYQQGSNTVVTTAFDPVSNGLNDLYDLAGIIWMNTKDGRKIDAQVMAGKRGGDSSYNGKAGGIGDIEFLNDPAPTEIGNRVWFDENANCVQDGNETGIEGVDLNLYTSSDCTGTVEQTLTTDTTGHYIFPVTAGTTYSICIDDIATQTPLNNKSLTCNSGGTTINNSDATPNGSSAKIDVAPLTIGANNHSFDFGFSPTAVTPEPTPIPEPTPEPTPIPADNRTTVDHTDGSCDCHGYSESSVPALNGLSIFVLIFLTSFTAFLFRKELTQND